MKYGIYFAYWEQEWNVDQKQYIEKVKRLGFDVLEISCAMLKETTARELQEMKKMAQDAGITLKFILSASNKSRQLGSAHRFGFYSSLIIWKISSFGR